MQKTQNRIAPHELEILKQRVEYTWGQELKISADCEKLQQHIQQTTGASVSANTLRRVFGFLQTAGRPALHTKNLLASYCGFASWEQMMERGAGENFAALSSADESLFYLDFFKIEVKSEEDINYHNACRSISKRILGNEGLFNRLAPALAANATAQVFFYERFPWLDGLATAYYLRGLRLYLQHKKSAEAQLFGGSLLFLSALLRGQGQEAGAVFKNIAASPCQPHFHDFLKARRLGSIILFKKWISGEDLTQEITRVHQLAKEAAKPAKRGFWRFPYFLFMMADYLNMAGLYSESALMVSGLQAQLPADYIIEQGYPEAWQVVRRIALHEQDPDGFLHWFEHFTGWEALDFLFRKFYRLQAICIYCTLPRAKGVKRLLAEKESLIRSTGFHFFKKPHRSAPFNYFKKPHPALP